VKFKNLRDRPLVDYGVLARSLLLLLHAGKVWVHVSQGAMS
jgi:hypothetical protein